MRTQHTLPAVSRAASRMHDAFAAYQAAACTGGDASRERRALLAAMVDYEQAIADHHQALADQMTKMAKDPRHVRPPRGEMKGL